MAVQNFYGCRDNSIVKGQVVTGKHNIIRVQRLQIVNSLEFLNPITRFQNQGVLKYKI